VGKFTAILFIKTFILKKIMHFFFQSNPGRTNLHFGGIIENSLINICYAVYFTIVKY